jgi:hypothetical protein
MFHLGLAARTPSYGCDPQERAGRDGGLPDILDVAFPTQEEFGHGRERRIIAQDLIYRAKRESFLRGGQIQDREIQSHGKLKRGSK